MIYDKLSNIEKYMGFHPHLDTAIRYLSSHDPASLPLGRTEVDGDNVFINVMDAEAGPLSTRSFEIHEKYMDIQIDLSGCELIQIGDSANMKTLSFNPETDFGVAECPELTTCTMGPGNFILCMAMEPHKPGIAASEDVSLRKCVVKVRW